LNPNPQGLEKRSKNSWHAIYDGKDFIVKMGNLVRNSKTTFLE
jgi:hypothetical protein